MNSQDPRYSQFGLTRDMLAVPDIIRRFDTQRMADVATAIRSVGRLLLTGEGSSRIFPAKSAMAHARRSNWPIALFSEAGRQAQECNFADWSVFALSNSGRTAEVIGLFTRLKEAGHPHRYSLTAFADSRLESLATRGFVLECGPEGAVAATKSVVEQALFYRALLESAAGQPTLQSRRAPLADAFTAVLSTSIDPMLIARIARAGTIYWAGRNDGVAEELTLKTNEITRRQSDFLEGTYAVHGVEEVMQADDVLLWVDPYPDSEQKFQDVLVKGVGLTVIAIAARDTMFPTIRIPDAGDLSPFVQMAAGWNVLVDVGLALGVNLDKPQRARKVGNEFVG
jgi:glucosamine--fructose-6-phosphate aminotransferase (isomerizing)